MAKKSIENCPCGSSLEYAKCCGPLIDDHVAATTALNLMRSRYTAYTLMNETYLLESWHPTTRPQTINLWQDSSVKWIGLEIVEKQAGGTNDETGVVEFIARYKINGKAHRLQERSRFKKENGRWFYLDGEMKTK